jgi:hypothetical protein
LYSFSCYGVSQLKKNTNWIKKAFSFEKIFRSNLGGIDRKDFCKGMGISIDDKLNLFKSNWVVLSEFLAFHTKTKFVGRE